MHESEDILKTVLDPGRRTFFKGAGVLGLGAAAAALLSNLPKLNAQSATAADTANQIFTAALVAEDLATTFYYNGLVGGAITDAALAGPGGTALNPSPSGDANNVSYIRAALGQEIQHANLLRAVGNIGASAATDPYQTFYFPAGTFDTLATFGATLEALENAFIGAYLTATREFAALAVATSSSVPDGPFGGPYSAAQLEYFSQVAASIMGIEAEHRVLGRDILNISQANNLNYEQTDGLLTVYNGPNSAVAALTPFLTPATGPAYSLANALTGSASLVLASTGSQPAVKPVSFTANPNPIPVTGGAMVGVTTIFWNAPSAQYIEVRVGSPSGPLVTLNFNSGSVQTFDWVTEGMVLYLQDVSNNLPLTAANTLATLTLHLKSS
jgi:Ferritin-like domain